MPRPGPSAALAALVVSGLPTGRFVFEGFLPRKGGGRGERLRALAAEERTMVVLEAPHRLERTLADLAGALGPDRAVVVTRELTKLHEDIRAGTLGELADYYSAVPPRGELTVVLQGTGEPAAEPDRTEDAVEQATSLLAEGLSRREVVQRLTQSLGLPRNEAYKLVMELP